LIERKLSSPVSVYSEACGAEFDPASQSPFARQNRLKWQGLLMRFHIKKGADIPIRAPSPAMQAELVQPGHVALCAIDFPGVRPEMKVVAGEKVRTGQTVFVDHHRPDIAFTAPATGRISDIVLTAHRSLDHVVITVENDQFVHFKIPKSTDNIRKLLLASGLWPAFISRPFGHIPDPDTSPTAIFVTAMNSAPGAADPALRVLAEPEAFKLGLEALKSLTQGPVYVCQAPGPALAQDDAQIRIAEFLGPHPSGLAGTHMHHILPVRAGRSLWQIAAQDVLAIGHLLATGTLSPWRDIALGGPGVALPRLIRTRRGAALADLAATIAGTASMPPLSGGLLEARHAAYLGWYHQQATVVQGALPPALGLGRIWAGLLQLLPAAPPGPLVPYAALEQGLAQDILPVPLLRALSVGDIEAAERLGCMDLIEEDLGLLSWLCPSGTNYAPLLRRVLDEIAQAA